MPGGFGGALEQATSGDLLKQIYQGLEPPNPSPMAQGAPGAPSGGAAVGGQPGQGGGALPAPSSVYGPDPMNANLLGQLVQLNQRDQYANSLNQAIGRAAASFGTKEQQEAKMRALGQDAGGGGAGYGSTLEAIAKGMDIQSAARTAAEHARFMAGASTFAQTLSTELGRPVSADEATEIMLNPGLLQQFGQAATANATTTSTVKDAEAATRAWAAAHPEASPKDIADYKASLIAGGMGGSDLEQRQYLEEKRNGVTTDDYATWKAKKAAQGLALGEQAKQSQEFKDTAIQDYSNLHTKYSQIQPYIDTLLKNPAAAQSAMGKIIIPTTGPWAAKMPGFLLSDDEKAAANALQKIQSTLSGEALANTKNVRNQREFDTLSRAATGGLNAAASPEDFQRTLQDLKNKYLDAQATSELAAGHKLTGELVGHGSSDLLSPTKPDGTPNPYYNGGSEEGTPLKGDDLAKVQQALADHPDKKEEIIATVRKNGYSPRGLF